MCPVNAGEDLFKILAEADEVIYIGELGDFAACFGTQPDGIACVFEMFDDGLEILFDFIVDFFLGIFHVISHMVADAPCSCFVGSGGGV